MIRPRKRVLSSDRSQISPPLRLTSLPNLDEADRIADERRGVLFPLYTIRNLVTVTPVCNPDDFLGRSRHKAR